LGQSAALSPATIVRLNAQFKAEYDEWRQRSLVEQRFVYLWVDGVHIKAGVARENAVVLTVIGANVDGRKHLIALEEGSRESKESWLEGSPPDDALRLPAPDRAAVRLPTTDRDSPPAIAS